MSFLTWLGFKPTAIVLANAMLRELRAMGQSDWRYVAESNELRNSQDASVHLGNIALEFRQARRSDRRALLRKYCALADGQAKEIPKLWTLAERSIYPIVRSRWDEPLFALHIRSQGHDPRRYASRALGGTLCIRIVYDFGAGVAHVDEELIETWGQSYDSALKSAMANLRSLESPVWQPVETGVFQLQSEVSYEESFVLLDRVRAGLPFAQTAVFMACNRGVLLAASGEDEGAVLRMIAMAEGSLHERPWPMSPELFCRTQAGWVPFAARGEVAHRAHELATSEFARLYGEQKDALDQINEAQGDDIFVASCSLMRRDEDGGALRSWCTWSDGVRSSLPRCDLVALVPNFDSETEPEILLVSWGAMDSVCGDRLHAEPFDPPRFRTEGFPSQSEWQQLLQSQ